MTESGLPSVRRRVASAEEYRLLDLFRGLQPGDRQSLLAFAAFLAAGGGSRAPSSPAQADAEASPPEKAEAREPRILPRPDDESVVAAIKRLSHCYDMLERRALLDEAATLMSAHLLGGRPAREVIDELEALFARHYDAYRRWFDDS